MGWRFRRSLKFGPLKVNLSQSGVGNSIGVRGFRVGKDARGRSYTAASIPGTGIYNRQYSGKAPPLSATLSSGVSPQRVIGRRLPVLLVLFAGIVLGMVLMALFSDRPAPAPPVAPPVQQAAPPAPTPVTHRAKRRGHAAKVRQQPAPPADGCSPSAPR